MLDCSRQCVQHPVTSLVVINFCLYFIMIRIPLGCQTIIGKGVVVTWTKRGQLYFFIKSTNLQSVNHSVSFLVLIFYASYVLNLCGFFWQIAPHLTLK